MKCEVCGRKAVTKDGRFCLKCLRFRIKQANPDVRDLSQRGTEQDGRSARDSGTLGGEPY